MEAVIKLPDNEAGHAIKAHLENEHTLTALSKIMDRLDTIEQAIDQLGNAIQQGPGMVEMATDVVDQTVKQLNDKGIDLENRAQQVATLVEKLTEPQTITQLTALVELAGQIPEITATAVDQVDALVKQGSEAGIDLEARLASGLQLLKRVSEPQTIQNLAALLDLADQLPELIGTAVTEVDKLVQQAAEDGINLEQRIQDGLKLLARISSPTLMAKLNEALDFIETGSDTIGLAVDKLDEIMGEFSRQCIDLTHLGENTQMMSFAAIKSLNLTMDEQPELKNPTLIGLIKQLNNKDFRKVLAFLATFGKHMGQELGK